MSYRLFSDSDSRLLNFAAVARTLRNLPRLRRNQMLTKLGYDVEPKEILAEDTLVLWIADLLWSVAIIDADQQQLIIDTFWKEFREIAVEHCTSDEPPLALFGIRDRRTMWASFSAGQSRLLDLLSGKFVNNGGEPAIEVITYNVTNIFVRNITQLKRKVGQE